MLPPPTYYVLLNLCWMYALLSGGKPERVGTTIMIVGSALTLVVGSGTSDRFGSVEADMVIVDVTAFIGFAILALRADRFWPIWVSAFAGLGVLGHLGQWYAGADVTPWVYATALMMWSYPILITFAIGTFNHQRSVAREIRFPSSGTIGPRAKA